MKKRASSAKFYFRQVGKGGCGLYGLNIQLQMVGIKNPVEFEFSRDKGISPKKILLEERKAGLSANPIYLSIRNIRPKLMLWLPPPLDHYVVTGEIAGGKIFIYGNGDGEPRWMRISTLKRKWYKLYGRRLRGWAIEVTKK